MEGNRHVTRKVKLYNLDVIISVGYRVKSQRGTEFRQWANVLRKLNIYGGRPNIICHRYRFIVIPLQIHCNCVTVGL